MPPVPGQGLATGKVKMYCLTVQPKPRLATLRCHASILDYLVSMDGVPQKRCWGLRMSFGSVRPRSHVAKWRHVRPRCCCSLLSTALQEIVLEKCFKTERKHFVAELCGCGRRRFARGWIRLRDVLHSCSGKPKSSREHPRPEKTYLLVAMQKIQLSYKHANIHPLCQR